MAYEKQEWEPRQGTGLNRFLKSQETAGEVCLDSAPLSVAKPGTPFSAERMNHIEGGIEGAHSLIGEETRARGEADAAEALARQQGDQALQGAIAEEAAAREAGDRDLQEAIGAEALAREGGDAALAQAAAEEALARKAADAAASAYMDALQRDFGAWIGRGGFLDAFDFGTEWPEQQALTDYALSQIPSVTEAARIWNGTKVKNLFDGAVWILTNTQDTDPPVFEWSWQGSAEIGPFGTNASGLIAGADPASDPDGYIQAVPGGGGKGKVIGFDNKAPANASLTNAAASSALPATGGASVAALLQTARNCLRWLVEQVALKANLASPALTGAPTAPTAAAGNNSSQIATTAYADMAVLAGMHPAQVIYLTQAGKEAELAARYGGAWLMASQTRTVSHTKAAWSERGSGGNGDMGTAVCISGLREGTKLTVSACANYGGGISLISNLRGTIQTINGGGSFNTVTVQAGENFHVSAISVSYTWVYEWNAVATIKTEYAYFRA